MFAFLVIICFCLDYCSYFTFFHCLYFAVVLYIIGVISVMYIMLVDR